MKKLTYTISLFATMVLGTSWAQTDSSITTAPDSNELSVEDSLRYMPFQYSFVHPMGTNGTYAAKTVNNLSVNLLIGYQGGLDGVEVGGFSNMLRYDMRGAQFAGFSNTVLGEVEGGQFAGFVNTSRGYTEGVQLSGFANVVDDSLKGVQGSGFTNVVNGNADALQLAGFSNLVRGEFEGMQGAGFANVNNDTVIGFQAAGFANVNRKGMTGTQLAGFANICNGDVEGTQVAGFVNKARKVKGVQIGVVNIADTIEDGIAIGVLTIVKNGGYTAFEVSASEALYVNGAFKIGTKRFYNIFALGFTPQQNDFMLGFGYGVGTQVGLNNIWHVSPELMYYHINETNSDEGDLFSKKYNALTRLNLNFARPLGEKREIFFGPALNVMVSKINKNGEIGSDLAPYAFYDFDGKHTSVDIWAGANFGIRF